MEPLLIATQGADCLAGLLRKDGSFTYRYNSGTGKKLSGYNALRHAGTIWAMLDVHSTSGDPKLVECCESGVSFLLNSYLRFYRSHKNVCICEDNKIKLGGNGLSILALLALYEQSGDTFLLDVSRQLGQFIVQQRPQGGDFIHKRYFKSGKISSFTSAYYTGEALLALLALYRLTRESIWLETVLEMEDYLAEEDYGVTEQSHWMLYVLEQLSSYEFRAAHQVHARKIAASILDQPGYLEWNRSTPLACRSEGLLAYLRLDQKEAEADDGFRARCLDQVEKNLEQQLLFRLDDGSFIRGGGDRRHEEVRIDYIQHNISSFLHYHNFMKTRGNYGFLRNANRLIDHD